jgi:hypothetical protein
LRALIVDSVDGPFSLSRSHSTALLDGNGFAIADLGTDPEDDLSIDRLLVFLLNHATAIADELEALRAVAGAARQRRQCMATHDLNEKHVVCDARLAAALAALDALEGE